MMAKKHMPVKKLRRRLWKLVKEIKKGKRKP